MLFDIVHERLAIGQERIRFRFRENMGIEIAVGATAAAVRYMKIKGESFTVAVHKKYLLWLLWGFTLCLFPGCHQDHTSPPASQVTAPDGMIYIPGGKFLTGSVKLADDPNIGPLREVSIPAFFIDKTEMSNAQVKAVFPEHTFIPGTENAPATALSYNQTVEVLARLGKRLPSSLEWEKAARGTDGRIYPWGNDPNYQGLAHVGTPRENTSCGWGHLVDVDSYPEGASPFGLLNTLGNAWEWVSDEPTKARPYHSIKGGAYGYPAHQNRLDNVSYEQPGAT